MDALGIVSLNEKSELMKAKISLYGNVFKERLTNGPDCRILSFGAEGREDIHGTGRGASNAFAQARPTDSRGPRDCRHESAGRNRHWRQARHRCAVRRHERDG